MPNLLQSQLAFFGAIDDAVLYAQDGGGPHPEAVLRTVNALLPGTAGFAQAGWYRELEAFANRPELAVDDLRVVVQFPTVEQALSNLEGSAAQPQAGSTAAVSGQGAGDSYDPLHDPALARSAYAAMVLHKIAALDGLRPRAGVEPEMPAQIMMSAINAWRGSPTRMSPQQAAADPLAQILLSDGVTTRESWQSIAAQHVSRLFAQQSLPCFGKLENVDGQYVSTLYTEATDPDLTVENIKEILDPRNWSICCKFFCDVEEQQPPYTKRGWSRILEKISPEPEKWCLKTALVFYYGEDKAGGIFLNYDLDPHRENDSNIVEVDKGYIWVTPHMDDSGKTGVRIRTSKQERVQGLSPTATSALGCLLGWGEAAFKLLAGTAEVVISGKKPPGFTVFPFELTPPNGYQSKTDNSPHQSPEADQPAKLPPNFGTAVEDARDLLNDLINRARIVGGDAATRWSDGMTREDVDKIAGDIGRNLREFALEMYDTAQDSVKPKETTDTEGRRR